MQKALPPPPPPLCRQMSAAPRKRGTETQAAHHTADKQCDSGADAAEVPAGRSLRQQSSPQDGAGTQTARILLPLAHTLLRRANAPVATRNGPLRHMKMGQHHNATPTEAVSVANTFVHNETLPKIFIKGNSASVRCNVLQAAPRQAEKAAGEATGAVTVRLCRPQL